MIINNNDDQNKLFIENQNNYEDSNFTKVNQ